MSFTAASPQKRRHTLVGGEGSDGFLGGIGGLLSASAGGSNAHGNVNNNSAEGASGYPYDSAYGTATLSESDDGELSSFLAASAGGGGGVPSSGRRPRHDASPLLSSPSSSSRYLRGDGAGGVVRPRAGTTAAAALGGVGGGSSGYGSLLSASSQRGAAAVGGDALSSLGLAPPAATSTPSASPVRIGGAEAALGGGGGRTRTATLPPPEHHGGAAFGLASPSTPPPLSGYPPRPLVAATNATTAASSSLSPLALSRRHPSPNQQQQQHGAASSASSPSSPSRSGGGGGLKSGGAAPPSSVASSSVPPSTSAGGGGTSATAAAPSPLRRRGRDAWDRRIRDQMWLFDSHSAAHPRNDPDALQEDAIDSFEFGPGHPDDYQSSSHHHRRGGGGDGAAGRGPSVVGAGGGGGSSPGRGRNGGGGGFVIADGVPIPVAAEGRSRTAGATIVDTTAHGGAVMVVGDTGRTADAGTQSMYGSTVDAAVATVITTADLGALIPFFDDAVMLRATLPSLQRLERRAAALLTHVRQGIEAHVQDAGVSYVQKNASSFLGGGDGSGGLPHHKSRRGQLGSQSIADLRRGMAEGSMAEAARGGGFGGRPRPTAVTVDGLGRTKVTPGTLFTNRAEMSFNGGSGAGLGGGPPQRREVFDPLLMRNIAAGGGVGNVGPLLTSSSGRGGGGGGGGAGGSGKGALASAGVSGYSLYDDAAVASAAGLRTLGAEVAARHAALDAINASVDYYSPLAVLGRGDAKNGGNDEFQQQQQPPPAHPTGGYSYTTAGGVTVGQWSRELDVATRGLGLQGYAAAQERHAREEWERREVVRRAVETIGGGGASAPSLAMDSRAHYASSAGAGAGAGGTAIPFSSSLNHQFAGGVGQQSHLQNHHGAPPHFSGSFAAGGGGPSAGPSALVSPTTTYVNQPSFSFAAPSAFTNSSLVERGGYGNGSGGYGGGGGGGGIHSSFGGVSSGGGSAGRSTPAMYGGHSLGGGGGPLSATIRGGGDRSTPATPLMGYR